MITAPTTTDHITTSFHLPQEVVSVCDKHYILYWNARFLYNHLLRSPRVVREGIAYVPVLQDNISLEWIGSHPDTQIRLSFRKLYGHRTGYVVIRKTPVVTESSTK